MASVASIHDAKAGAAAGVVGENMRAPCKNWSVNAGRRVASRRAMQLASPTNDYLHPVVVYMVQVPGGVILEERWRGMLWVPVKVYGVGRICVAEPGRVYPGGRQ